LTSRQNGKNTMVCAQNTSTTHTTLSTIQFKGGGTIHFNPSR
jgi:hypothetical protein